MNDDEKAYARIKDASGDVCDLFCNNGWPRIEVMIDIQDRRTLPLSDDDADKVRALRKALEI